MNLESKQKNLDFEGNSSNQEDETVQAIESNGASEHEPITREGLEHLLDPKFVPEQKPGALFLFKARDNGQLMFGYFGSKKGKPGLLPFELTAEEQQQCRQLLGSEVDFGKTSGDVQELHGVDHRESIIQSEEDGDILYRNPDGTPIYKQDKYDKEKGTY